MQADGVQFAQNCDKGPSPLQIYCGWIVGQRHLGLATAKVCTPARIIFVPAHMHTRWLQADNIHSMQLVLIVSAAGTFAAFATPACHALSVATAIKPL